MDYRDYRHLALGREKVRSAVRRSDPGRRRLARGTTVGAGLGQGRSGPH